MSIKVTFDGDAFKRSAIKQAEDKIKKALSGHRFSGLKIEFNWSKADSINISGPDDQVAAAQKILKDKFSK